MHQPSAALAGLLGAAERAGVDASAAKLVVRGVLSTFADRLPAAEREHVLAHLPPDIRTLFAPPRRIAGARLPRTAADLVGRIAATTSGLPLERAAAVTETIVHELKSLVPDEARDVAAVLPPGLRPLWDGAA